MAVKSITIAMSINHYKYAFNNMDLQTWPSWLVKVITNDTIVLLPGSLITASIILMAVTYGMKTAYKRSIISAICSAFMSISWLMHSIFVLADRVHFSRTFNHPITGVDHSAIVSNLFTAAFCLIFCIIHICNAYYLHTHAYLKNSKRTRTENHED